MALSEHWYKNAIMYAIDIEVFLDSNGDGVGDIPGLTRHLDYLAALGVTCIWVLPCFPTPNLDNGYDVADYYGIDPRLGSPGDYAQFLREADLRGIRVINDLVTNHTSDQHPWFQESRKDPESPYRHYYVWREQKPENIQRKQIVFHRHEEDIDPWTWDEAASAYYQHRFYDFEPDLNTSHPDVLEEIHKIMAFWLQLGVSGFRVDAAPYLGEMPASPGEKPLGPHDVLRGFRDVASAHRGNSVLLAEADAPPDELADYFGDGHEMHMLFNFYLNNFLFLALATEQAEPITRAFNTLPEKPAIGQWVNWVRNYDELDLERLSQEEREKVYDVFAPDPEMRIYNRGIRRRLPPMVHGDRRRMELVYSLVFSLPGTPCLFMGEEIGMGDDLSRPGRNSVRTPLQWSNEANGGFSTAPREKLVRPVINEGPFSYHHVNVADQRRDPNSFLNWMRRMIAVRRESPEIGSGEFYALKTEQACVLAHACSWQDRSVITLHNLSDNDCSVSLDVGDLPVDDTLELFSDRLYEPTDLARERVELGPYGYRWFRAGGTARRPEKEIDSARSDDSRRRGGN